MRAIWTPNSKRFLCNLPSALYAIFFKEVLGFFPLPSWGLTFFLDISPAQGPTHPAVSQLLLFQKLHLGISGVFFFFVIFLPSSPACTFELNIRPLVV